MYAVTSIEPEMRTRATLRRAELGFLGVVVYTRVHTPRRCGAATFFLRPLPDFRPGVASFFLAGVRPLRINWLVVGMRNGSVAGARIRTVYIVWRQPAEVPNSQNPPPTGAFSDISASETLMSPRRRG